MNEGERNRADSVRISLIAISSLLVTLPQLLWTVFGYRGILLIAADTIFIALAFFALLISLTDPLPYIVTNSVDRIVPEKKSGELKTQNRTSIRPYISYVMLSYLLVPYAVSIMMGYAATPLFLEIAYLGITIIGISFLVLFHRKKDEGKEVPALYYYIVLAVLGLLWAFSFWYGSPRFPTDELTLDYYSAHLFITGTNPYVPVNTSNVFSFYTFGNGGFPLDVITPFSRGGFVTNLSYPAMSIFAFVPANLLGIYPTASLIPLYVVPALFLFRAYHYSRLRNFALLPAFLILLNPAFMVQVALGYPDIIWVVFMILSVYFYRKPGVSGIFMGIALAVKQIPWLVVPFFFIFLYKENGRTQSLKWLLSAVLFFLLINSVFIIRAPVDFFNAVMAPEMQEILGIGFGPSQLAFLGILPLSKTFFTLMVTATFTASLIAYMAYYKRLRYAFLSFPVIIFLFNYRLLISYLMFWPIIALLMPLLIKPSAEEKREPHKKSNLLKKLTVRKAVLPLVLVSLVVSPVVYQVLTIDTSPQIEIQQVVVSDITGSNVTGLTLTLDLHTGIISYGQILYRIMPSTSTTNMNGYLWKAVNFTRLNSGSEVITIIPMDQTQVLYWSGNYRIIAYYGYVCDAKVFTIDSGQIR